MSGASLRIALSGLWLLALAPAPGLAFTLDDPFSTAIGTSKAYTLARSDTAGPALPCQFGVPGSPLSMQEAAERALCNNPKTRQAWALARVRAAEVGQAKATYLPQLSATVDYTKTEQNYQQALGTTFNVTTQGYSLRLGWVLIDLGRRSARLNQARALLDAANATHDGTLQKAFLDALQTYFDSIRAQAGWRTALDAETLAKTALKIATGRYKAGAVSLADKLQAETAASRATAERIKAEGEWRKSQGVLASSLGLSPSTPLALPAPSQLKLRQDSVPGVDELLGQAIESHPAVMAAVAEVAAAEQKIRLARAEGRPALTLNGQYLNTPPPDSSIVSPDSVTTIGVQLSIPIFQGFEPRYKVRGAEAELEAKRAVLADTRQQVELQIWQAYQDWQGSNENLAAAESLSRSAAETLRVTRGRYQAGVGNISEWLNAQQTQAEAQLNQVSAEAAWRAARISLAASMGRLGLWILQ
jgi:outer membrane protein